MTYAVNETQVESIARALFEIQTASGTDPDAVASRSVQLMHTVEELSVLYTKPYPSENAPAWKLMRPAAILYYAAMHEMGLI